jgi:hypothetical protein
MPRTFSTKAGSFERLKLRERCAAMLAARKQAMRHVLADTGLGSQAAHAPMGLLDRASLKGPVQEIGHTLVVQSPWPPISRLITQSRQPVFDAASSPLAHCRLGHSELLADDAGRDSFGSHQHDARALRNGLRRAPRARHLLQFSPLLPLQFQRRIRTHLAHHFIRASTYRKRRKKHATNLCGGTLGLPLIY